MQPQRSDPFHVRRAMHLARSATLLAVFIAGLHGCVTPSRTTVDQPSVSSKCTVAATGGTPAESIAVAATAPINPAHAPFPTNSAERFVFAQVYETLIGVDCEGHAYSGLAKSWTIDATKTRVTLILRDGAQFSNGEPLSARDVVAAWRAAGTPSDSSLARHMVDATTIVDDRTLLVSLPDTEVRVLAEPSLAVYRSTATSRWPLGSGPYRALESASDVAPGRLALVPIVPRSDPRLTIRTGPDARDAIDSGIDLLLGADPQAVRYAAARPDLSAMELPWQRTYVLAVPSRTPGAVTDFPATSDSGTAFRASLARDAVRADARGAGTNGWWTTNCELKIPNRMRPTSRGQRRIVFRADDHVARELAERLVALGRRAVAAPLSPADFESAFVSGSEGAYVLALPHQSLAPCRDLTALASSASWLARDGVVDGALVPLVDTREPALVNRQRVTATIDWDGTLRMGTGRR